MKGKKGKKGEVDVPRTQDNCINKLGLEVNKSSGKTRKEIIAQRLNEAGISTERGINVKGKKPTEEWKDVSLPPITKIEGNYGIRTGNGLVVFDVDNWNELNQEIKEFLNENPTLVTETPHSEEKDGHYYFATESDINRNIDGLDIQGKGAIVIGAGSTLENCRKGCCSPKNVGTYEIKRNRPIQSVAVEKIEDIVPEKMTKDSTESKDIDLNLPKYDKSKAQKGQEMLQELNDKSNAFFTDLMSRLRGKMGDHKEKLLNRKTGSIDRSLLDLMTYQDLYGCFIEIESCNSEQAKDLAYHTYTHFATEQKYTSDGQTKKWIARGKDDYRKHIVNDALEDFDRTLFRKNLNKTTEHETKELIRRNEYSQVTKGIARFVTDMLSGYFADYTVQEIYDILPIYNISLDKDSIKALRNTHTNSHSIHPVSVNTDMGCEYLYPPKSDVLDFCERMSGVFKGKEKKRSRESFDKVLKQLQQRGMYKVAEIKCGNDYRIYPSEYPNPKNANWVRSNGEKTVLD